MLRQAIFINEINILLLLIQLNIQDVSHQTERGFLFIPLTILKMFWRNFQQNNFSICEFLRHQGKGWKCTVIRSVCLYVSQLPFKISRVLLNVVFRVNDSSS